MYSNLFNNVVLSYIPHGHCYLWKSELVLLHTLSDALIAIAYFSIPCTLGYFVFKRKDLPYPWIFSLFGLFIISCGITHIFEIWTLWHPTYWLSGAAKAFTAAVSMLTAVQLFPIVPQALALSSPAELEFLNQTLQREVIERQQIEVALQKSQQLLDNAFEFSLIGNALVTPEGNWIKVNPALCKILGYSESELIATNFRSITFADDLEADQRYINQLLSGETNGCQFEKRYVHKQGHIIWALLDVFLICDSERHPLNFIVQIQDISQRKQAEGDLQQLNKDLECLVQERTIQLEKAFNSLKASEASYQDLYNNAPDMYVSVEAQTNKISQCNQTLCNALGFSKDEILNQSLFDIYHPDCHSQVESTNQTFLETGELKDAQLQLLRQDGSKLDVSLNAQAVRDDTGNVRHSRLSWRDITERKKLEAKLTNAIETAESANHSKSQFFANMSHELRTPLNGILGFSQLLLRDPLITPDQQASLNTINRSGEHLLSLINDVLTISKIEAGAITYDPKDINLIHLCDDLRDLFAIQAESKALSFQFYLNSNVPQSIKTDDKKLKQILINLLGNALKFTEQGKVECLIDYQLSESDPRFYTLYFTIKDTGPGIPEPLQETLFAPFTQNPLTREKHGGTGLGLSICKNFVQLMGGEITLESREGHGSSFHFNIQVEPGEQIHSPQSAPERVIGIAQGQPSYRILVVDDHPDNRQFLVMLLQSVGFEIREAQNGHEAITLNRDWKPHLIWMDLQMPELNGLEATQHIKSDPHAPIIIALTAQAFAEQEVQALEAGCDDYVRKPCHETVLFEKMAQHLGITYLFDNSKSGRTPHNLLSLSVEELSMMPLAWVKQLHDATLNLDERVLNNLIEGVPYEAQTLKSQLENLVNNYRFDIIMNTTKAILGM